MLVCLTGCTVERGGDAPPVPASPPAPSASASGPVELREPVALARVVPAGGTSVLPDPEGERLALEEPFLTITRLAGARTEFQEYTGSWVVVLSLTGEDARAFGDWTAEHVGERLAVLVNGRVVFAPTIQSAIPGGEVVITARYSQRQATDLLAQLTGG